MANNKPHWSTIKDPVKRRIAKEKQEARIEANKENSKQNKYDTNQHASFAGMARGLRNTLGMNAEETKPRADGKKYIGDNPKIAKRYDSDRRTSAKERGNEKESKRVSVTEQSRYKNQMANARTEDARQKRIAGYEDRKAKIYKDSDDKVNKSIADKAETARKMAGGESKPKPKSQADIARETAGNVIAAKGSETKAKTKAKTPSGKPSKYDSGTRGEAFKAARKAGMKSFMYKGKRYNTKTAEEKDSGRKMSLPAEKATRKNQKAVAASKYARNKKAAETSRNKKETKENASNKLKGEGKYTKAAEDLAKVLAKTSDRKKVNTPAEPKKSTKKRSKPDNFYGPNGKLKGAGGQFKAGISNLFGTRR
jgi:hypothetical protein